ncbi:hypothetical protein IKX12_03750 [Candidatus Saccharibacteria bacterium]|nr:hypothetical protein [Candidatus Saccharibacteria bacterium]
MAKTEDLTTFDRSYERTLTPVSTRTYTPEEIIKSAIMREDENPIIKIFQAINANISGNFYNCGPYCGPYCTLNKNDAKKIRHLFKIVALKICMGNMSMDYADMLIACAASIINMREFAKDALFAANYCLSDNKTPIPDSLSEGLQKEERDSETLLTIATTNDRLFKRVLQAIAEGEIVTKDATINACLLIGADSGSSLRSAMLSFGSLLQ